MSIRTGPRAPHVPPVTLTSAAIEADSLVKSYAGGKVTALQGLSFQVAGGSVFGLLGPNGAGKSTAVKILTTLSRPDSGTAHVAGIDVLGQPDQVRRAIGTVAQKPQFDPEATGYENLVLQGRLHGVGRSDCRARADELLERVGLGAVAGRLARTYSGGMQRKLDVALGLVHRPQVLFLDEPTTGLDPEARAEMWQEMSGLAADGLTILLTTTHYLEEADNLADRIAIVDRGAVVAEGTPDQLKAELRGDAVVVGLADTAEPAHARAALGSVPGVYEIAVEQSTLRARVESGASAVPQVLATLESAGVSVTSVTISRPSLDDVYLRPAGRSFEYAEKEDAA
ncbi:MAG: ATP-binding cassette domain-containing protein [Streptosporangiales bacterium]